MKFVHVISRNHLSLTPSIISFFSENFFKEEHNLCTVGYYERLKKEIDIDGNILYFQIKQRTSIFQFFKLYKYLNEYDVVVLHGMYLSRPAISLLFFFPQLLKKIVWIGYGQDIYNFDKNFSGSIFQKIRIKFVAQICKRFNCFVAIFPPDIKLFQSKLDKNIKCYYIPYTIAKDEYFMRNFSRHESLRNKCIQNKPIRILIGHRGAKFLNQKKWISELIRFKDNNIEIIVPMGGARNEYKDEVNSFGKELLGQKITIFYDFLTFLELKKMTENIDIAIFDCDFQVALGTIHLLFFNGAKVFMPSTSLMYDFFKSQNIFIEDLNELPLMNFERFITDVDMSSAYNYVKNIKNYENSINNWKKLFVELEKKHLLNNSEK